MDTRYAIYPHGYNIFGMLSLQWLVLQWGFKAYKTFHYYFLREQFFKFLKGQASIFVVLLLFVFFFFSFPCPRKAYVLLEQCQSCMSSNLPTHCQEDICSEPASWTERDTLSQQNYHLSISKLINKLMAWINEKDLGEILIKETTADTNYVSNVLM